MKRRHWSPEIAKKRGYEVGKRFGVMVIVDIVSLGQMMCRCDCGLYSMQPAHSLNAKRSRCGNSVCLLPDLPKPKPHPKPRAQKWTSENKNIYRIWSKGGTTNDVREQAKCSFRRLYRVVETKEGIPYHLAMARKRGHTIGLKQGYLTIEAIEKASRSRYNLGCRCECGNQITLTPFVWGMGRVYCSHACGMKLVEADSLWIGETFGMLTVLHRDENKRFFMCQCECGNRMSAHSSNLRQGRTKSCGCSRRASIEGRAT